MFAFFCKAKELITKEMFVDLSLGSFQAVLFNAGLINVKYPYLQPANTGILH